MAIECKILSKNNISLQSLIHHHEGIRGDKIKYIFDRISSTFTLSID